MSLGTPEILLCLLVALLVLGPDKIPQAARQLGKAMSEMRKLSNAMHSQVDEMIKADDADQAAKDQAKQANPNTHGYRLIDQRSSDPDETGEEPSQRDRST